MTTLGAASYYDNSTDQHLKKEVIVVSWQTLIISQELDLLLFEYDHRPDGLKRSFKILKPYIPMWDSYYMKFNYPSASNSTSNKGNHMKIRCAYYPN